MALSEQDQRRIVEQESSWVDSAFGGIDLSQFPDLQPPPPEQSRDDGRFAKDWRDTALSASAAALRKFVEDPDTAALERVGNEIGHEGFRDEVRDRRGEAIAQAFKRACPDYIPTQANYERMVGTLSFNALSAAQQEGGIDEQVDALIDGGFWTVGNLTATYHALTREGLLDVPVGQPRNLSERERLRISRMAQAGRIDEAIGEYLRCALDGKEPTLELVNDPAYRDVCDSAVWTVFEDITHDYVPTPTREAFIRRHCAGRPVTLPLLQSAWAACQRQEASYTRQEVLDQFQRPQDTPPPSAKELDAMNDDEVDRLYHASLKSYAQSVRRPNGVLA